MLLGIFHLYLSLLIAYASALGGQQGSQDSSASLYVSVDLSKVFNNQGVAKSVDQLDQGSFDGRGNSFASESFPTGKIYVDNTPFVLKDNYGDPVFDNLWCDGSSVPLPTGRYYSLKLLAASDTPRTSLNIQVPGQFTFVYSDGSKYEFNTLVPQWQSWEYITSSAIVGPYSWSKDGKVGGSTLKDGTSPQNRTQIYSLEISLPQIDKSLTSMIVPKVTENDAWHIFAATLVSTPALQAKKSQSFFVESVKSTQRWEDIDGQRVQYVEVVIANTPSQDVGSKPITVEITSSSAKTLTPTKITRLPKGNFIRVDVPILGWQGVDEVATVTIRDVKSKSVLATSKGWPVRPGLTDYVNNDESLSRIQAPNWWRNAKLGVMFHWGIYAVPAYGSGSYAEWYMHDMSLNDDTKAYHLKTFGEKVVYDDFIANFTASAFDASKWVQMMENSGSRYSVGVTKHHDGFALFDTKETSNRNSLKLGPKRDFTKELMVAMSNSSVKFGTYFSATEWFNPIQNPYGFGAFPGGPYRNAYTDEPSPYTGYVEKSDFIDDIQSPQQQILMEDYRTNIMWCDIGGPSRSCENAAKWYNSARERGQNVVMNNRCGCLWNGFGTPEYTTYPGTVQNLWETNEGLAPFSYGFNAQDAPNSYKTPQELVSTLVDVVSKNGNFLINFGPDATGLVPQAQQDGLLGLGKWLKINGDAIYDTRYWALTPQEKDWRFTTKDGAFYMISLTKPSTSYSFSSPIPVQAGDSISLLGATGKVDYTIDKAGRLTIKPTSKQIQQGSLAWAFRIQQF